MGIAYASAEIIALMDKTKPPYNVSRFNQEEALKALSKPEKHAYRVATILRERALLEKELQRLPVVKHIYPSDANFLLVEVTDADAIYHYLVSQKVIVRNRHSVVRNCIRITVGTAEENKILLQALRDYGNGNENL